MNNNSAYEPFDTPSLPRITFPTPSPKIEKCQLSIFDCVNTHSSCFLVKNSRVFCYQINNLDWCRQKSTVVASLAADYLDLLIDVAEILGIEQKQLPWWVKCTYNVVRFVRITCLSCYDSDETSTLFYQYLSNVARGSRIYGGFTSFCV